jgi:predicted amidohydrolase YtcJ
MRFPLSAASLVTVAVAMTPTNTPAAAPQPPETIFVADRVYTLEADGPTAEAVAVRDGLIQAVGTAEDVLALAGGGTAVRRLDGAVIVPGLVDAHCHLLSLGLGLDRLDLVGTSSYEEVLEIVRGKVESARPGEWIQGRGWDQNDWADPQWPTRDELDRIAPGNPVYLKRVDGHAALANSVALELAGIDEHTPDPANGKIVRDGGRPIGVLIDDAMDLVAAVVPSATKEMKRKAILRAAQLCMSAGLVGVHEAGVTAGTLDVYRDMADSGELPFYVYAMISGTEETLDEMLKAGPEVRRGGALTVRAIKLYADGALGSRGAAMIEPYSDDPGNTGILMVDEDSLAAFTENALRHKFQVCVHAIGDRANRIVLDSYERAQRAAGVAGPHARLRIEHAQILAPGDIPRFASLGVIASMQPTHCTSDMPWAPSRLGAGRLPGAYAWHSLLNSGAHLAGGSDFPVESYDPLLGFYAAVTRETTGGHPVDGWNPSEKMTREEALAAFTSEAAYAAFDEHVAGTLAPGKRADMTVLGADIMRAPKQDIPRAEVVMTIIGGRVMYEQEEVE